MIKKLISCLILAAVALTVSAEFRWGPSVGINISNYTFSQKLIGTEQLIGPNAGVIGELMFPGIGFGIDLGLRYQMHGGKINFSEKMIWSSDGIENQSVWLHTLQLPVNLRFKYTNLGGTEDIIAPFAYAGPVFSLTLAHTDCKALEYPAGCVGIQVGGGAELFRRFQISGGYCWGLTYELRTLKLDNFTARTNGWQVNLTYLF